MEVVEPEFERRSLAVAAHLLLEVGADLLDHFLDPGRVDAAVGDEPLDGLLGDLAAIRVEARQDDGARRVVDDEVDAGGDFERADVPALAADDASLEIVTGKIDHRDRGFHGVLGGAALDGLGDQLARAGRGGLAGLGLEPLHHVGRIAPGVGFELLEQDVAGLVGGQPGDALEFPLLFDDERFVPGRGLAGVAFPLGHGAFLGPQVPIALLQAAHPLGEFLLPAQHGLLEPR